MAGADDPAFDSELAAQPDVQSVGQHHQARGNLLAVRQHDCLPFRAGRNRQRLGVHLLDAGPDFGPDGADQHVVHDAVLLVRLLVEQVAEARDPVLAALGGRSQRRLRQTGPAKPLDLLVAAQFLDPEVGRIHRMRVDQDGRDAGAPEHGGRDGTGQAAADDRNVGVFHGSVRARSPILAPAKANKALAPVPALKLSGSGGPVTD